MVDEEEDKGRGRRRKAQAGMNTSAALVDEEGTLCGLGRSRTRSSKSFTVERAAQLPPIMHPFALLKSDLGGDSLLQKRFQSLGSKFIACVCLPQLCCYPVQISKISKPRREVTH